MKDIIWLIRKTLISKFRNKRSWFLYFGLPIAGALLSMLLYGNASGTDLRVGIVNEDGNQAITADTIQFVGELKQVRVNATDKTSLNQAIEDGKLDIGIIIDKGFADSVRSGNPGKMTIVSIKGAQVTAAVKSMLQSYIGNITAIGKETSGDQEAFDRIYEGYRQPSFKLTADTVKDTSSTKSVTYQTFGYLITFMMFSAVNMSGLILREKENRTFLRIFSSPISARTYVLANVAVNVIIMLLQIVVTLFFMRNVFHIDSGVSYIEFVPVLLLFGLSSVGLSLMIVAFAQSGAIAGAMQNLIITPTCLLAGCFFPMDIMPDTVRRISNFLPQHWLLDTVNKLQQGNKLGSLYLNLAIMAAFAAAFSLIAIYRFGRNNDTRMFV
ncbi:ABC transporter permease [Paenibacillus sp. PR3]|uniref:Transport permease protein n=1 Tax=Paenibacillus terricola TaxID=2763503 RepID=A0ABR8N4Z3_9BACL|nr:ABC transporter permease [Paenibacillus terricola]MBD3922492.1 ABC transporter permease [Paenibacillus terricola]